MGTSAPPPSSLWNSRTGPCLAEGWPPTPRPGPPPGELAGLERWADAPAVLAGSRGPGGHRTGSALIQSLSSGSVATAALRPRGLGWGPSLAPPLTISFSSSNVCCHRTAESHSPWQLPRCFGCRAPWRAEFSLFVLVCIVFCLNRCLPSSLS